eukprot:CAMPEP_0202840428 /NCGR_PEP_ID=MMETSP1389-20130828/55627_1 /ASSEMBLY_ACC=CAM_ASM_000865 /TAXON_ID=302021 /ORGANISM="Rhodomonas sp., Strain CCMP768" /LENGTH=76 /DNA_ID=CAMNT_0049517057 /DNA_START=82 /DNA_END=309 /DNA_ORIENTATION=+
MSGLRGKGKSGLTAALRLSGDCGEEALSIGLTSSPGAPRELESQGLSSPGLALVLKLGSASAEVVSRPAEREEKES